MFNPITTVLVLLVVGTCCVADTTVLSTGTTEYGGMAVAAIVPENTLFRMKSGGDTINVTTSSTIESVTIIGIIMCGETLFVGVFHVCVFCVWIWVGSNIQLFRFGL